MKPAVVLASLLLGGCATVDGEAEPASLAQFEFHAQRDGVGSMAMLAAFEWEDGTCDLRYGFSLDTAQQGLTAIVEVSSEGRTLSFGSFHAGMFYARVGDLSLDRPGPGISYNWTGGAEFPGAYEILVIVDGIADTPIRMAFDVACTDEVQADASFRDQALVVDGAARDDGVALYTPVFSATASGRSELVTRASPTCWYAWVFASSIGSLSIERNGDEVTAIGMGTTHRVTGCGPAGGWAIVMPVTAGNVAVAVVG